MLHFHDYHTPYSLSLKNNHPTAQSPLTEIFVRKASKSMEFVCYCGASSPGRSVLKLHRSFCVISAPDMTILSPLPAEVVELDAFLDEGLVDIMPKAHLSDQFDLSLGDVDVGSLRRCDEISPLSPGYMDDSSEELSGDDTDVTLPLIRSPSLPFEKPFQHAGQELDHPFFTFYDLRGSNTNDVRNSSPRFVKRRRSERANNSKTSYTSRNPLQGQQTTSYITRQDLLTVKRPKHQ
ncbi:hypothetical protein K457DRAFT_26315 [Linnemannia elongata AG-77]|uniref:Uncharacterized protein n=1 Tax=Linnemannia elongata AG-77 TaxID=1314771 RepID=A0A197JAQ2_9FUNG|nr:hypothetical protein K457DRAFT_26315 [Linnemannia elongata AG-77]